MKKHAALKSIVIFVVIFFDYVVYTLTNFAFVNFQVPETLMQELKLFGIITLLVQLFGLSIVVFPERISKTIFFSSILASGIMLIISFLKINVFDSIPYFIGSFMMVGVTLLTMFWKSQRNKIGAEEI